MSPKVVCYFNWNNFSETIYSICIGPLAKGTKSHHFFVDVLGTPAYFAPETLRCVVYESQTGYGQPVDL